MPTFGRKLCLGLQTAVTARPSFFQPDPRALREAINGPLNVSAPPPYLMASSSEGVTRSGVQILPLPLAGCHFLAKSFTFSKPQLAHL